MTEPAPTPKSIFADLLVLDVATILAGPLVATLLGDLGAEVIKVEHPRGDPLRGLGPTKDGESLMWKVVNRNKLGVTLDLKAEADADAFRQLVKRADVLVENFRPGTLERWGLGWEQLRRLNPRLIMVRMTGFGQTGPYASRPGFGTLAEAMSGFAHVTGHPDGPPTLPSFGLADSVAGITGAWAAVSALYHRDASGGTGQYIDLAIYEPLLTVLGAQVTYYDQLGVVEGRTGNRTPLSSPRNVYGTADNHWVAVSAAAPTVAARLLKLAGRDDLIAPGSHTSDPAGRADELDAAVAEWIRARDLEEVLRMCEQAEVAVFPIYAADDVVRDPQVRHRGSLVTVEDAVLGPVLMQNVIARHSETPGSVRSTGPAKGEHNGLVFRRFGITDVDVVNS